MSRLPRVGDQFGRYRIDVQLGEGGMGVVFGATDTAFDRRVALKVVSGSLSGSEEFLLRFEREAALLARLNSPHVIAIFDYGEHDGCPFIATQYVAGGDLGGLLAARGPMPPAMAARVCAQVADALHDAHRAGVVHRDVKPTNVLLRDADGGAGEVHAYLCDFGIARADTEGLTTAGSVAGTWSYLAPECGSGSPGTPASDLYALGCLWWAALTGRAPYGGTDVEIAVAHQRASLPQLQGDDQFTALANQILARSLAKDPAQRYPDADAMRADLLAVADRPGSGVHPLAAPRPTPGSASDLERPPPAPRRRRTPILLALAGVAALVIAGGVVATATGRVGGDDPGPIEPSRSTASIPPITPTTPTDSPSADPALGGPVTGDLDGDGLGDVSLSHQPGKAAAKAGADSTISTWSSTGSAFGAPSSHDVTVPKKNSREPVRGDFDGDGRLEVLQVEVPFRRTGGVTVRGSLSTAGRVRSTLDRPARARYVTVLAGDVDGDGTDDLVLLAWDDDVSFVFGYARANGTGFVTAPDKRLRLRSTYRTSAVELGDYDGDGRVDLVTVTTPEVETGEPLKAVIVVHRGTGAGFARNVASSETVSTTYRQELLAADLDGDADDELVLARASAGDFMTLSSMDWAGARLTRPASAGLLPVDQSAQFDTSLGIVDGDGDGRDDVVSIGPSRRPKLAELQVARFTGSRFAGATRWATWRTDLTDTYGPTILGTSFP